MWTATAIPTSMTSSAWSPISARAPEFIRPDIADISPLRGEMFAWLPGLDVDVTGVERSASTICSLSLPPGVPADPESIIFARAVLGMDAG
jgi:hypothetical protein